MLPVKRSRCSRVILSAAKDLCPARDPSLALRACASREAKGVSSLKCLGRQAGSKWNHMGVPFSWTKRFFHQRCLDLCALMRLATHSFSLREPAGDLPAVCRQPPQLTTSVPSQECVSVSQRTLLVHRSLDHLAWHTSRSDGPGAALHTP